LEYLSRGLSQIHFKNKRKMYPKNAEVYMKLKKRSTLPPNAFIVTYCNCRIIDHKKFP